MRAILQRVTQASVTVDDKITGSIKTGLLILLGIEDADTDDDITKLSSKIVNLRIFNDAQGVMNLSIKEVNGEILLVSQFTLYADSTVTFFPFSNCTLARYYSTVNLPSLSFRVC